MLLIIQTLEYEMLSKRKLPRNEVSFTMFRQLQLLAVKEIWVLFANRETVDVDVRLLAWSIGHALQEGRYADAVSQSGALSEQQYGEITDYRLSAQLVALVKKVPFKDSSLDPEGNAFAKYLQAESDCCENNKVLRLFAALMNGTSTDERCICEDAQRVTRILMRAQHYVKKAIGNKPPLAKIYEMCRFGTGAAVGIHGNSTHLLRKLSEPKWTCTRVAAPYVKAAAKLSPMFWEALGLGEEATLIPKLQCRQGDRGLYEHFNTKHEVEAKRLYDLWLSPNHAEELFDEAMETRISYVEHDLINFVLKQADCHRAVGNQPLLNTFIQLGTGDWMFDALKRVGIDLRYGAEELNGPLAFLGSSCEGLPFSTIDLRSASDTLCIGICKLLLPPAWFNFLNNIRTPGFQTKQMEARYEKFVAMGNGFCFPLETLIFWSLVQAVYDHNELPDRTCAVYGDDIIVYQSAALELIEVLEVAGFDTNTSKTFVYGPFRESCGQDFFNGVNVRPFVLDEVIENWGQVYHLINSLRNKGYRALAEKLIELVPEKRRLYRHRPGTSDSAIEVPEDVFLASPFTKWNKDLQCWSWKERFTVPVQDQETYDERVHLRVALNGGTPDSETGTVVGTKRRETRTFVRWVAHG